MKPARTLSPQGLKIWWSMVAGLSWRVKSSFLLLWVLLSCAIFLAAILLTEETRKAQFEDASLHIRKTLEERLLICETAIYGFAELSASSYGADRQRLGQFAENISSRYPYIYLMGFQPKVSLAERAAYEADISFRLLRPFLIKDYQSDSDGGWVNNQRWRPAPPRPVYFPLVDAQPASARRYEFMLGLDISQDAILGAAVQKAIRSGEFEVTRPYVMREGGRGFGYVKAVYAEGVAPATIEERIASVVGVITVGVRAEALLSPDTDGGHALQAQLVLGDRQEDGVLAAPTNVVDEAPLWAGLSRWLMPHEQFRELQVERAYFPYRLKVGRVQAYGKLPPQLFWLSGSAAAIVVSLLLLVAASQHHERLQAERYHEVLQRERQRALVTLENIDDAVLVLGRDFNLTFVNHKAAVLLGGDVKLLIGRSLESVWQVHYELAREWMPDLVAECMATGVQCELPESAYLRREGEEGLYIEGTIAPLLDEDGTVNSVVITFRDMAPMRRRMAEALDKSELRLKQHQAELARVARINTLGEMTSGIAHEINQPLSAIVSYNEACLSLLDDEEPDRILLKSALLSSVKQAQRAGHIVKRLRDFAVSKQTDLVPVDLNQAVLNVIAMIEAELRDHQVEVDTHLGVDLPLVMADAIQIEQVIMNLAKNAMEAMATQSSHRRLFIYTEQRNGYNRVGLRDSGPGLPHDVLQKIFQPFFSSKPQGMGLGLTISNTIIENLEGTLAARNLETGGAEFAFELPGIRPEEVM